MNTSSFDSIIFDMDGTLWDAIASYCEIWRICFSHRSVDFPFSDDEIKAYMGTPIDGIFDDIVRRTGVQFDRSAFLSEISRVEDEEMLRLGGKLYPGVVDGISRLSRHYRLFMVSNCSRYGLRNFIAFTGTTPYFTDSLSYGERSVPKSENIKEIIRRHGLKQPIYLGDTQGDCDESHRAGIDFAYASWGFGSCSGYELKFDSFSEFAAYFLNGKE
ncbi:MAG: HAD family hydrolase [Muribaculaceae bacterium]